MNLKVLLLFILAITAVLAEKKSYSGFKVYKVTTKTHDEVKTAQIIQEKAKAEIWEDYFVQNRSSRVMVEGAKQKTFLEDMKNANIEVAEIINDVQSLINKQMQPSTTQRSAYLSFSWDRYYNLEDTYNWLDELAAEFPSIVTTVVMGRTLENREIKGIVINYNRNRDNVQAAFIEGTLHSREWITPATVTWIIKEFLTSTDPRVRSLAEHFEWHIFPIVNPDGFEYTFNQNRMWRKNRNPANFRSCGVGVDDDMSNGVDLNRNFDFQWMTIGASDDPCTNTFAGPNPGSELETQAIKSYVQTVARDHDIMYYLAFHSYTQLIIVPYSHLESVGAGGLPNNYNDMYQIGVRGADAIRERHGTNYRVGLSADVMYPMSGASFDWVKGVVNAHLAYLIEVRDMGEYGFLLPPEQIIPNSEEIMDGLLAMDAEAQSLGYYSSSASNVFISVTVMLFGLLLAFA